MGNSVGLQSNTFYYGCVEDRQDPLKLGRVRVRIVGVHSESIADIPTEKLPWATVMMSANNPVNSGVGTSPNGLLEGSWVVVIFADGANLQNPVVLGSLPGFNPTSKPNVAETERETKESGRVTTSSAPFVDILASGSLSDESAVPSSAPRNTPGFQPGNVVKKYESGTRGVGTISTGKGDAGGKSYGTYQISSKAGTLKTYIKFSRFSSSFAGIQLASKEFDEVWSKLASSKNAEFQEDQRLFIEKTHFAPALNRLSFLDIQNRGDCIAEMVWSYAVQYGAGGGPTKIKRALNGKNVADLSDADIIELCYNDRYAYVPYDFRSSPSNHPGLKSRFKREKQDILNMSGQTPTPGLQPADPLPLDSYGNIVESESTITNTPSIGATYGGNSFADPSGKYPRVGYLGKPDTNRLARNEEINKTIHKVKQLSALNGNGFTEPYTFSPSYPFNKVYESESGHVIEIDDSAGGERIHIYHKSGSFIEFHPDGTIVKKSVLDDNEVVISNKSVYVVGSHSIFVEGETTINSLGNISMQSEGNIAIRAGGNVELAAAGRMEVLSGLSMDIGAGGAISMTGSVISQNAGGGSPNVEVNIGEKLELQAIAADEEEPEELDDYDHASGGANQTFSSKFEMDTKAGFVTESGAATTSPQDISVAAATVNQPDVSSINSISTFKGSFKLSPSFVLSDVTTNTAAFRYALKAQAGLTEQAIVTNLTYLATNVLEPLIERFGRNAFIITNAFRHIRGGSKTSKHHLGQAVDIQFPGNANNIPHIAQEIRQLLPNYDQIILEYHANNPVIHIAYVHGKNRKMIFSTFSSNFSGLRPYGIYDRNQNLIYKA